MTPRPFYRSRLFWLGLPGLVFLLWAWTNSYSRHAGVGCPSPGWAQAGSYNGKLYAARDPREGAVNRDDWWADSWPVPQPFDVTAWLREMQGPVFLTVPHYAVVLAYVAAWLLTLAWWQRRKSRLLKLHSAP